MRRVFVFSEETQIKKDWELKEGSEGWRIEQGRFWLHHDSITSKDSFSGDFMIDIAFIGDWSVGVSLFGEHIERSGEPNQFLRIEKRGSNLLVVGGKDLPLNISLKNGASDVPSRLAIACPYNPFYLAGVVVTGGEIERKELSEPK